MEHPDDDLWTSIGAAARSAMAAFPGDTADIAGVGLCTIRFCRAVLKADGTLAQPVMSWMDDRVSRPYEHVVPDARWVTTSSGYIGHRLTGAFRDTAANYAGMWPLDSDTWQWSDDEEPWAKTGMRRDMLFDLVMPGDVLGNRDRRRVPAHRHPRRAAPRRHRQRQGRRGAGLRPARLRHPARLPRHLRGRHDDRPRNLPDATGFWTNYASVPHSYLYESFGVRRGMWTVSWLRDLLGEEVAAGARAAGLSVEENLNTKAAEVPPGCDGLLTVLDWLAPTEAPYRKGTVLGFDGRQGRYHMYRSILEGLALTLHGTAGRMADELGTSWTHTLLSGGGSSSDLMMQIFADVFGVPAHRAEVNNAAGLGAAMCAAVGTGAHTTFDDAREAMVRAGKVITPDPAHHALYTRLGKVYRRIQDHTDPIYRETWDITGQRSSIPAPLSAPTSGPSGASRSP
ncbi:FGGY-family carbohydrate kinase [Streptomyces sp. NPDC042319]|uniref:FGGY-family carbohydrate kinase n=1 Tax=Streptomyces sp. NPDC042319 TaxID=3154332 RepID=UPI0033FBE851